LGVGATVPIVVSCRIVVADDSLLVRVALESLLESEPDLTIVASVDSLPSLLDAVQIEKVDLVITDVRMPPTLTDEGIQAAELLRAQHPDLGVIVLSQHADGEYLKRLVAGGTARRGYLLKDNLATPDQLTTAIGLVQAGGSFIDPSVVEALVQQRQTRTDSKLARLSPREIEILSGVASGRSNMAIADMLFIGHRAVEKHINSIFAKLDLNDDPDANRRVQAALLFLNNHDTDSATSTSH
jgi:DNA-binding NarL/FixJ family response regulator